MQEFAPLLAVTEHWKSFPAPWFVAGGWAIDLFLGRETRPHHDVELSVFRDDQPLLLRHFAGWRWQRCVAPGELEPWSGERIEAPLHQLLAQAEHAPAFDVLLNEREGEIWRFRRNPDVTLPLAAIADTRRGLPYLRPELTLLYKAKHLRPQDEADFALVLPRLPAASRRWLTEAIARTHPRHPWIGMASP